MMRRRPQRVFEDVPPGGAPITPDQLEIADKLDLGD